MAERQSILKEIGTKKGLQYLIDRTQEKYRPIIWPNFFEWRETTKITYETLIGSVGIGAAASVVSYNSAAPLRTRKHVKKLTGEIPSLREKFQMSETDLMEYIAMTSGANSDERAIIDLIFRDVKEAAESPHKRLDYMVLEALSTGQISLSTTTNPDGIITESAIDFGMPAANKTGVAVVWSAGATCTPITDIMKVVELAEGLGIKLEKIRMRRSVWNNMRKSTELAGFVTAWAIGKSDPKVNLNLELVNEFLLAEGLPIISLVDVSIGIEKDGVVSAKTPFSSQNIAYTPAGMLGDMLNAPIVERIYPAKDVNYADYNRALIKKWGNTDPVSEFTGVELNAFPSWKNVDFCFLQNTASTETYS